MSEALELKGETIELLPERAIWWEKEKTLVVADLHWGKSGHFRRHGIPIPSRTQETDELRLAALLQQKKAQRLVIAGDLFHSKSNQQVTTFRHFRNQHPKVRFDLVVGNHDILPAADYETYQLEQHTSCLNIGPFCIAHDWLKTDAFLIHGHIHPALRIKSPGKHQPTLKLCCFALQNNRMILPAFGEFTGTHLLDQDDFSGLYIIGDGKVIRWK